MVESVLPLQRGAEDLNNSRLLHCGTPLETRDIEKINSILQNVKSVILLYVQCTSIALLGRGTLLLLRFYRRRIIDSGNVFKKWGGYRNNFVSSS